MVEGEGVESEAVKAAVDKSIHKQQVELEQFAHVLDVLRSGSSAAPQQAAWMKLIVHGQQMLSVETIEQPLYTCTAADMICGVTGRVLRPWALPLFMSNLTRFHIDLEINPLLRGLMHAHGKMAVPCVECGSATRYIGDSMTIEKDRKQPSVTGGGAVSALPKRPLLAIDVWHERLQQHRVQVQQGAVCTHRAASQDATSNSSSHQD